MKKRSIQNKIEEQKGGRAEAKDEEFPYREEHTEDAGSDPVNLQGYRRQPAASSDHLLSANFCKRRKSKRNKER